MPFYRFQLEVSLAPEAVAEKIRAVTREPLGFFAREPMYPSGESSNWFWGSVRGTSFKLRRNIERSYRNSFLPQIRGRISLTGGGSRLQVTMFVHPLVAVFMAFWLLMAGSMAVSPIAGDAATSFTTWGMLAFGLALPPVAFFPEAIKARRMIEELATARAYQPIQ